MPNRRDSDCLGHLVRVYCRLRPFGADVVKGETAENSTDETPDHIHAEKNENLHVITSLLKRKLTAVKGSGIVAIISEKFQAFNNGARIDLAKLIFCDILSATKLEGENFFLSKENQTKGRRSFRVIFKIIKFIAAMVLTFFISFAVTLAMKSEDNYFSSLKENFFQDKAQLPVANVPEIKTIYDEQNSLPFTPEKYSDIAEKKTARVEEITVEDTPPITLGEEEEELGIFDALGRMTSIKPAVDEKIKSIPHYVAIDKMPFMLLQAVVAVEDTRFYKHKGFDIFGIARAVLVNVEAGEIQEGASTITQQTVKNLFLTSDQTFTRKTEELILSMNMEKNFDKDKILEIYLNSIYFGSDFYGIYDAAQGYFGKEPDELTMAECAMLAGLPNAPSLYSPYVDFHLAKKRQLVVIDAMEKTGVISSREAEKARVEEIILVH